MKKIIVPSILSADLGRLMEQIQQLKDAGATWIHLDVMDGHFVPNLTFGPMMISAVKKYFPDLKLDVHLMITNAETFYEPFIDAGADLISVHIEAVTHLHGLIHKIKSRGCKAGIVINPSTPVEWTYPVLPFVDLVLVMSVNPGFPAQELIKEVLSKGTALKDFRDRNHSSFILEIDGGINPQTIPAAMNHGFDWFVAGNAVFGDSEGPAAGFLKLMKQLANYEKNHFSDTQ